MQRNVLTIIAMLMLATACVRPERPAPLARVYDKYLYASDISDDVFGTSSSDSAMLMRVYIDKWVQTQLLLRLAELNLSDADKDVSHELENYRTSLLVFKYEQEYINQKMDTTFTDDDVLRYYEDNRESFVLDKNIAKALYIKLRKEAPQVKRIRELYRSSHEQDLQMLDNLAYQAAIKYDYFGDRWVDIDMILQQLPPAASPALYMNQVRSQGHIDIEDGEFAYLVNFKEVMRRGEIMPYEYSSDQIRTIMLNTRRNGVIRELERNVMLQGRDKGAVEIFFK